MSRKRKSRKKNNNKKIFDIIAIISILIALIFGVMLYILAMIPFKYLIVLYIIFLILYLILSILTFKKNIKTSLKVFSIVLFIIFDIIFGFGIKYIGDTINFVDVINSELLQKEEYYVMVLKTSNSKKIEDLENSNIGVYSSSNSDKAFKKLEKEITSTKKEYTDTSKMFDDLENNKLDAVLINSSIKSLFNDELADTAKNLKEIYKFSIAIKKVDIVKAVDVTRKPFNIYVAGGDAYGSIDNVTNTDVNMIITVDPVNKKILLTSIPRDYYVNLPSFGENAYDKLTHAGYYGIEESIKTIEKLLDIDINYYVKVNFSTIEGIVDAIDGVDVNVDKAFTASDGSYYFNTGMNHMNGKKALRFARERKVFLDGDVQRVKNQQKVLEAVIKKVTSSTKLVTSFTRILDSVSSSLSTNMDNKSINKFVKMQLNNMSSWSIESQNLIGTDYSSTNTYTFPGINLYVMKQDEESINKAKQNIKQIK